MTTTATTITITDVRFDGNDVLATIGGKATRFSRKKCYHIDGAVLRSMVLHRQADGRCSFLITAYPRKAHRAEMPGRGRCKFTGFEYAVAVTKDNKRTKVNESGYWIQIETLCFQIDLLD